MGKHVGEYERIGMVEDLPLRVRAEKHVQSGRAGSHLVRELLALMPSDVELAVLENVNRHIADSPKVEHWPGYHTAQGYIERLRAGLRRAT